MKAMEPTGIAPWREPPSEFARRNLGIATVETGMERESWPQIVNGYRILTDVQDQFPQDGEMFQTIGNALFIGRQYGEAATAFELAVHFDPASSVKESSLGSAYIALGRNGLAESHLERALDLDPLNLSAAELLIDLYEKNGETTKEGMLKHRIEDLVR